MLDGYLSADGYSNGTIVECHTVSKRLLFSIKAIANSLGHSVTTYAQPNSTVIQGRTVNSRPLFKARWRCNPVSSHSQTLKSDGIEWCPVRDQSDTGNVDVVYNIGVEEDESYIAEGLIVHNCKHFSRAKGGKPVDKNIRGLAWVTIKYAATVKPKLIFLENVQEFQDWGPLDENGRPIKALKAKHFDNWLKEFRRLG